MLAAMFLPRKPVIAFWDFRPAIMRNAPSQKIPQSITPAMSNGRGCKGRNSPVVYQPGRFRKGRCSLMLHLVSISIQGNVYHINYRKELPEESAAYTIVNSSSACKNNERFFIVKNGRIVEELRPRLLKAA